MTIQILRTATPNNPPPMLAEGQLAVEMATHPPRLWCGVPISIDPRGRVEVAIGGEDVGGDYTTGDAKLTLQTYADPGWVMCDDLALGSDGSGAHHAGPEFEALFKLLFVNLTDATAPIFSNAAVLQTRANYGAGEPGAQAAWELHARIQLPKVLGRAAAIAGQGAGLSHRPPAGPLGEETHAQILAELPQHNHAFADPSHQHVGGQAMANGISGGYHFCPSWSTELTFMGWHSISGGDVSVAFGGTGVLTQQNGSSSGLNVTQPSAAWNIMLKL